LSSSMVIVHFDACAACPAKAVRGAVGIPT
jgi:hypothetical protein